MIPEREELAHRVEVTLKEYIDVKFQALNDSVITAKSELDRRLADMNELRKEVLLDRRQFLNLEVFNATLKEWSMWRETTVNRITIMETRAVTWTAALGVFFIVLQLFLYWFVHK